MISPMNYFKKFSEKGINMFILEINDVISEFNQRNKRMERISSSKALKMLKVYSPNYEIELFTFEDFINF